MKTDELMHKRKRHSRKRRCRNVCTFRIPLLGICLSRKRKCPRRKKR